LILISILSITVAAIGGYFLYFTINNPEPIQTPQTQQPAPKQPVVGSQKVTAVPGAYVQYSEQAFAEASGTRILFFHANWCPQCRMLHADIESQTLPDNTTIFKVNYDTENELRKKYGVTQQTTFVQVNQTGDKLSSFVAYNTPTYASVAKQFNIQ
jgi:thiol-disulfide isomerase/thioredoxin